MPFSDSVDTYEHAGFTIRIEYDADSENPRQWCNLATLWIEPDRGYIDLSDSHAGGDLDEHVQDFVGQLYDYRMLRDEPEEVARLIEKHHPGSVAEPVYLDRHKGVGYVLAETIRKEYSRKRISAEIRGRVRDGINVEARTLDEWGRGEVYGYVIEDQDGEHVDSCWGFMPYDYCKSQAEESAEYERQRREQERAERQAEHERIDAATAAHWSAASIEEARP